MDRRVIAVVLVLAIAGAGIGLFVTIGPSEHAETVAVPEAATSPTDGADAPAAPEAEGGDYDARLRFLDEQIAARSRAAATRADDWLSWEIIGSQYVERARLSGDYADYRHAEESLERAFSIAPEGAGPHLARAGLHFTLHRLDRVEPDLVIAESAGVVTDRDRATIRSLRADVAFHRGDYDTARTMYEAELTHGRTISSLVTMAQYRWKTGDFDGAVALLDEAIPLGVGQGASTRAWLHLVRGLLELDRARNEDALEHFEAGLRELPRYPLLEDHAAEARMELGQTDAARATYEALVERTQDPEFMDQLARIARERGDEALFTQWRDRARVIYEQRLEAFPEAAYGHALDHYLELEDDTARAVELAERNRDQRPGGEAQTKLAQAYLRAGRALDARRVIDALELTPWSTADSHGTAALVYELSASGDPAIVERAASERARAEAIAPGTTEDLEWLRTLPPVTPG